MACIGLFDAIKYGSHIRESAVYKEAAIVLYTSREFIWELYLILGPAW